MKKTKKNFTLVELLCAVGLVVILAGIGFSAYSYASHRGKEAATKSLITRLGAGLETLKTKHGFYPSTFDSSDKKKRFAQIFFEMGNNGIITALKFKYEGTAIATVSNSKQLKDMLAVLDAENIKKHLVKETPTSDDHFLTDSWGGAIYYAYPGFFNTIKFDLIATGADGGLGKDAKEIQKNKESKIPDDRNKYVDSTTSEWACDDIANFK